MSFMEVAYPLKNPVACPTAQERLESWKTIQPKRIQRKKLFPLSFPGLANSWSHAGNRVERRGKQLLLPEIPISRNWRLLCISHPDFCLKVFSTVARCCWVLRLGFSSSAPFTTPAEQWLCWGAGLRVLYLTSVLSKSSLSTAEKFGAGFTQSLGSWVISEHSSAHPGKDCGKTAVPFKDFCSLHRGNYYLKLLNTDGNFGLRF